MDGILQIDREGPVATVVLNRPKVFNAFNADLRQAMREAVVSLEADPEVRVVVIRGEGPGFCAGADLSEGLAGDVTAMLEEEYKPFLTGIAQSEKLWIASVHGSAAGIGGSLAMTCDLMVMSEDASIYLAFAAIGLIPDGGATWHLFQAMGYRRALQTVLEGRKIPASECLALGIANRLETAHEVHGVAMQWARELAQRSPLAQKAAKRVMRQVGAISMADAISLEAREQGPLTQSEDFREAVASFFRKEKPVFKGR